MFKAFKFFGSTALAATVAVFAVTTTADAKRRAPVCHAALSGTATSTGILGLGTAIARDAARADFEQRASNAYGSRYGDFRRARGVRWNCKPNAILLAKCVVTARPCRA